MKSKIAMFAIAIAALFLTAPSLAGAAVGDPFGQGFGVAEINGAHPDQAPAYSGPDPVTGELEPFERALWAGTCDLSSADTTGGGVGPHNGGIAPPANPPHCLDFGVSSNSSGTVVADGRVWLAGLEPRWRLSPVTQAGAHPDASAAFFFAKRGTRVEGTVKNIVVKLPPGVVGNPEAVPKCSALEAQAVPSSCSPPNQLGIATLSFGAGIPDIQNIPTETKPVFAVEARDTVTAEFSVSGVGGNRFNVFITARGRTNSDYGVDTLALLIPDFAALHGQVFTFWGVPWAAAHDPYRVSQIDKQAYPYEEDWGPIKPFFMNPTRCNPEPDPVTLEMDSWQNQVVLGGEWVRSTTYAPAITGCDQLEFDPGIALKPTVDVADSPSGLDVSLTIPQNNDPPGSVAFDPDDSTGAPAYWRTAAGLATAHLKDTVVALPKGTSFNPAAANGLRGCTTAQIGLTATEPDVTFNNDPAQCPDESRIGTLRIVSPLLPDPLFGEVFAAPQHDNPFPGTLTAIYLVAQDYERGLSVKLAGKVDLDPETGQISTTFVDNPQLPFNLFELHFKTGPRAPLNTPATCGQFENSADLTPWSFPDSGPQPTIHDPFTIGTMPNGLACVTEPEDRSFAPGFEAGSTSTRAAAYADFVLNVTRRDGEQEISGVALDMPPGVTGNLSQISYCPEASIAGARVKTGQEETEQHSCPDSSYIGRVDTLAGAGPLPLPTAGRLYLSGPYDPDGAGPKPQSPLSVTTIVPAIAGGVPGEPAFDLGNVVIRTGINVESQTARVHIDTTDVPYIVGGVPLRIRSVAVKLDRPGFMLNPTNCEELAVGGGINGSADPLDRSDDVLARVSSRFQVDGCMELPFKPKLTLQVKGAPRRAAYQQLTATMTPRPGDANLKSISVALPSAIFLAQNHINTVCTRVQYAAKACPEGSVYGSAKAVTPLLKDPLEGPVYLRSSNNPLPDMVVGLKGQVDLDVVGRVDSVNQGLRNSFEVTPDAPVSKFTLKLKGGRKSLLVNSENICFRTRKVTKTVNGEKVVTRKKVRFSPKATVKYVAQNGIRLTQKVPVLSSACDKKKSGKTKATGPKKKRG